MMLNGSKNIQLNLADLHGIIQHLEDSSDPQLQLYLLRGLKMLRVPVLEPEGSSENFDITSLGYKTGNYKAIYSGQF